MAEEPARAVAKHELRPAGVETPVVRRVAPDLRVARLEADLLGGRAVAGEVRRPRVIGDEVVRHGHVVRGHPLQEGERLAGVIGDKHVLFMKNHGVVVVGNTIAQAYRRLYKLEQVCRAQILAMSTGQPLQVLSEAIVAEVQSPPIADRHSRAERERLFFEAMMRVLDRELPGYAQ